LEAYRKALKLNPAVTGIYRSYMAIILDKKLEDEVVVVGRQKPSTPARSTRRRTRPSEIFTKKEIDTPTPSVTIKTR